MVLRRRAPWLRPGNGASSTQSLPDSALSGGVPAVFSARSRLCSQAGDTSPFCPSPSSLLSCLFLQMSGFKSLFRFVVARRAICLTFVHLGLVYSSENGGDDADWHLVPRGRSAEAPHPPLRSAEPRAAWGVVLPNQTVSPSLCVPHGNTGWFEISLSTV